MKFSPPYPNTLTYYQGRWQHSSSDDPVLMWYEVDPDGSCLRQIEVFADGSREKDSLENYPDGKTGYGFGTLHGDCFWKSEWDDVFDPTKQDSTFLAEVTSAQFEEEWTT